MLVLMKIHFLFLKTQFLIQECASLITKPNFISTLSYAIDNPLHYQKVGITFILVVLRIWLSFFFFLKNVTF